MHRSEEGNWSNRTARRAYHWLTRRNILRHRPAEQIVYTRRGIDIPGLPDALAGMTIAHLSDLHIGDLITPDVLPQIVDVTMSHQADLIVITGDFVDHTNDYLPELVAWLSQLEAPLGVYGVLGNHDYRDDAEILSEALADADVRLLENAAKSLRHRDCTIGLGGIDWTVGAGPLKKTVHQAAQAMADDADLKLLLAHNPDAFDAACRLGIHLVLSGHTHGGQMVWRTQNRKPAKNTLGLGNLMFKYPLGLYRKGPHRLYVSPGVGSTFPMRFRCPPEVTLLRLRKGV